MTPWSTYGASGVRRRNRAMTILYFDSEPVVAEGVVTEELVLLALGEGRNDALERTVERVEGAIDLVHRKVAAGRSSPPRLELHAFRPAQERKFPSRRIVFSDGPRKTLLPGC
jgi:hypothetical protein